MPLLDPNQSYTFSRYFELGFEQGINSYRVPEDLEPLMRILVAALKQTNSGGLSQ